VTQKKLQIVFLVTQVICLLTRE